MTALSELSPALAEVELRLWQQVWRGDALGRTTNTGVSTGFDQLNRELPGGGWPTHGLIELLTCTSGIGEVRFLSHPLQQTTVDGRQILLIAPPHTPYRIGWANCGLDVAKTLLVYATSPADQLWAIEQSIRSAAYGMLLAWVPETRPANLRRLQLAATQSAGLTFLIRKASTAKQPSPALLRLQLEPQAAQKLAVQILKRRGPPCGEMLSLQLPELRPLRKPVRWLKPVLTSLPNHALDRATLP